MCGLPLRRSWSRSQIFIHRFHSSNVTIVILSQATTMRCYSCELVPVVLPHPGARVQLLINKTKVGELDPGPARPGGLLWPLPVSVSRPRPPGPALTRVKLRVRKHSGPENNQSASGVMWHQQSLIVIDLELIVCSNSNVRLTFGS